MLSVQLVNRDTPPKLPVAAVAVILTLAGTLVAATCARAGDEPIEITLERTSCFGRCPVYMVTISGDGSVSYEGRQFVGVTGKQHAHIEPSAVRALVHEFEAINFFALRDAYRTVDNPDGTVTHVTDLPTTFVGLRLGDRFKRVEDYFGGPNGLRALERRIDEVAGTKQWIDGPPTPAH